MPRQQFFDPITLVSRRWPHNWQQRLGHKLPSRASIVAQSGPDTLLVEQDHTAVSVEFEPGTDAVWLVGYPLSVGSYLARGYWTRPGHISTGRWSAALEAAEMSFREHLVARLSTLPVNLERQESGEGSSARGEADPRME